MQKIKRIAIVMLCFCLMLSGCVSVKETKASNDPTTSADTESNFSELINEIESEETVESTESEETETTTSEESSETVEESTEPEETSDSSTTTESSGETEATTPEVIFKEVNETVYATGDVNIRKGPSTDYSSIGVLATGKSVTRIGVGDNGWSKVLYNNSEAYISSKYLSTEKPKVVSPASISYPIQYSDSSASITITKEWYGHAWCYIAHLQFSDYSRLGTSCANGSYNSGYEKTSSAAKRLGAIFCVNGDYSAPSLNYVVVRGGKIYNGDGRTLWSPGVYSKYTGLLQSGWETGGTPGIAGENVNTLVNNGIVTDTFCFGPPFLINGTVTAGDDSSRAQRTFIGTNGNPGDIWVVVSEGRNVDGESSGLTAKECANLLKEKGCTLGVPLDGGGSSTMVFNGQILNHLSSEGERAVVDFLYLK